MAVLLGRKIGMTQIFTEEGQQIPVTVLEAGPIYVTQIKTEEKDGYNAVQLGFGDLKKSRTNKPLEGHFNKAGVEPKKRLVEMKVANPSEYSLGQELKADIFSEGDFVDISGISKGKGTAGHIKRHNHSRGPMTHGSKFKRLNGSKGSSATPSRVFKGVPGPGRMGYERVTVQNLKVVRVDADRNLILVKGAVPGPKKGIITMKSTVKVNKK